MQTATELDRAAVEPLANGLLDTFYIDISNDRFKQFIGHAARQIMEALGYYLDRQGIRITMENMFASASRYRSTIRTVSAAVDGHHAGEQTEVDGKDGEQSFTDG